MKTTARPAMLRTMSASLRMVTLRQHAGRSPAERDGASVLRQVLAGTSVPYFTYRRRCGSSGSKAEGRSAVTGVLLLRIWPRGRATRGAAWHPCYLLLSWPSPTSRAPAPGSIAVRGRSASSGARTRAVARTSRLRPQLVEPDSFDSCQGGGSRVEEAMGKRLGRAPETWKRYGRAWRNTSRTSGSCGCRKLSSSMVGARL
jgi:hypothetical protein